MLQAFIQNCMTLNFLSSQLIALCSPLSALRALSSELCSNPHTLAAQASAGAEKNPNVSEGVSK